MAIKVGDLNRWKQLKLGDALALNSDRQRQVRLEVNVDQPTQVMAVRGTDVVLLGVVMGMDVIEFVTDGPTEVAFTTEGQVFYFTRDGDSEALDLVEEVSFATLANRRARNPQVELMFYKMNQNMERRLAQQADDFERRMAEMGYDPDTGEVADDDDDGTVEGDTAAAEAAAGGISGTDAEASGDAARAPGGGAGTA
ncbi:hypothetical protein [Tortoise microvirus 78]|nr:hypothetical protein [Tortoise microvirus 78]